MAMSLSNYSIIERMLYINKKLEADSYPNAYKLADEMECSVPTIYRALDFLRDRLNAPIQYDTYRRGYYYTEPYSLAANL